MAKTKTANKTTETKKAPTKELAVLKLTKEEKKCLANHRKRFRRTPLKFTDTKTNDGISPLRPISTRRSRGS